MLVRLRSSFSLFLLPLFFVGVGVGGCVRVRVRALWYVVGEDRGKGGDPADSAAAHFRWKAGAAAITARPFCFLQVREATHPLRRPHR
eukprot:SAG31_NODE_8834_length_1377_cov_7.518293_3_plen_88_part_01